MKSNETRALRAVSVPALGFLTALAVSPAIACGGSRGDEPVTAAACIEGATRDCAIELQSHDDVIDCASGTKTCTGGQWGACKSASTVSYSVPAPSAVAATLGEGSGSTTLGT